MILGHQKNLEFLRNSIRNGKIAHAYLFWGEAQLGKKRVAIEFAKMILCPDSSDVTHCQNCRTCKDTENHIHPDVHFIEPEQAGLSAVALPARRSLGVGGAKAGLRPARLGVATLRRSQAEVASATQAGTITIQQIRALRCLLGLTPLNGKYKIAIIDGAEKMSQEAANAFLKTIEEPSGNAVIILVSSAPNFLPETILSRVQQIRFSRVDYDTLINFLAAGGMNRVEAEDLIRISQNKPGKILNFLKDGSSLSRFKKEVTELCNLAAPKNYFERFAYFEKRKNDGDPGYFLELYLWIFRDILLFKAGRDEAIALNFKQKETRELAGKLSCVEILKTLKLIRRIHALSRTTNLNLKLALEFLMLNFTPLEVRPAEGTAAAA